MPAHITSCQGRLSGTKAGLEAHKKLLQLRAAGHGRRSRQRARIRGKFPL